MAVYAEVQAALNATEEELLLDGYLQKKARRHREGRRRAAKRAA